MAGRGRPDGQAAAERSASERLRALVAGPDGAAPRTAGRLVRRWIPAGWGRARVDPGRPGAVALAAVAAVAAVVAAVGVWRERPVAEPAPALPSVVGQGPGSASGSADPSGSSAAPGGLLVSVSGKVSRPGLVRVPDGARVADVITAAGGPLPGADLAGLNLARKVTDGEQVLVGTPPPAGAGSAGGAESADGAGSARGPGGKVDLNLATLQQLDGLPGVGPVTAQRILDWRSRHGRFTKVEQLREVDGIGERRFGQLRGLVTV